MTKEIVLTQKLSKSYIQGKEEYLVFKNINFKITQGEMIALIGPSGSGKTSFLNILGLLDEYTSGSLYINGEDVSLFSNKKKSSIRGKNIGFIFQFHHLLPDFTALENVIIPQIINGINKIDAKNQAIKVLTKLGLKNKLDSYPSSLSGGEAQRVAISRAISLNPNLLIADEPTGNLDKQNANDVFNLLLSLSKEKNIAILVATHDTTLANSMPRQIKLENKILVEMQ